MRIQGRQIALEDGLALSLGDDYRTVAAVLTQRFPEARLNSDKYIKLRKVWIDGFQMDCMFLFLRRQLIRMDATVDVMSYCGGSVANMTELHRAASEVMDILSARVEQSFTDLVSQDTTRGSCDYSNAQITASVSSGRDSDGVFITIGKRR